MIKQQIKIKTTILPNAPTEFRKKVGRLLNQLMKEYKIKGKDKGWEKAFKDTFKSNLYYIIDNYFNVKK